MKRIGLVLVMVFAAQANAIPAKDLPKGPPSKAVTEEILDAVAEEMNRALSLEIPGAPKPYHISYKITEVDVNDAAATLGHTTSKRNRHFVNIEARVRVKGRVNDVATFGGQAVGLHLQQTDISFKR